MWITVLFYEGKRHVQSFVPREVFLTRGVGKHKHRLSSFEEALRQAGVANQNLVSVSSILPPGCKVISRKEGVAKLTPGAIRFAVISRIDTNEHNRLISASIGFAQPKDKTKWGYISEVHGHGMNKAAVAIAIWNRCRGARVSLYKKI